MTRNLLRYQHDDSGKTTPHRRGDSASGKNSQVKRIKITGFSQAAAYLAHLRGTRIFAAAAALALAVILTTRLSRMRHRTRIAPTGEPTAPPTSTIPAPQDPAEPDRPFDHQSVAAHIAATALTRPDQIALRTATEMVTYRELLSAAMRQPGLAGDGARAVLIAGTLTPATVSTILGLFATGTAVVALDPELPPNRAQRISDVLAGHGYVIGEAPTADEIGCGETEFGVGIGVDDLCSIQFTSGSTGSPKAVLYPNGLWLADAQLLNERFGLADGRRVALCMPISFAAGLNVLIASLAGGAEVIAVDPREHSPRAAFDRIRNSAAQAITCTPAFVDALHTAARGETLPAVQRIVTTGEAAHSRHVRLARELAPAAVFTNWVGSTETLAIASYDIPPTSPLPMGVVPVGIPAPHKRVDIDEAGAVSIASRHLSLGYLDPAAASGVFSTSADGLRRYAGGDVGRWDDFGNLVLSGRADATVKIRGYLVEPAEIESTLLSYDDIREAAVIADLSGTASLTAYVTPSASVRTPAVADLRTRLHRDLPPWMVPAHIVIVSGLPRTERGKVDRLALPKPERPQFDPAQGHQEEKIAALWADILRVDAVGRNDGFYALGGDSLGVAQMLARVEKTYGLKLNPADLASSPTVAAFAARVSGSRSHRRRFGKRALQPTTVALRSGVGQAGGPPLMCFPGAGASSLCFAPLAARTGDDTAVYAFEPIGLHTRGIPDWSVQRAARRHLTDLRRLQPHGPYVLVGHSLGAHIALEVARALEVDGETIELLVMLDPWLSPRAAADARRDLPDVAVTLEESIPTDAASWWAHQKTVPLAGLVVGDNARKAIAVEEVGVMTGLRYKPGPWSGRALLVLSHLNKDDPRLWPRILTGDLTMKILECDHHSIVREPHVTEVIEMIADVRGQDSATGSVA